MYEKFQKLLDEKNVTANRVAKATGIDRSAFTHWKNGKFTPKINTLEKIADYFNVPVSYFYEEKEGKPTYYMDDETLRLAQDLHDDPEFRAMFSADKKTRKEEMEKVKQILKIMKGDNE